MISPLDDEISLKCTRTICPYILSDRTHFLGGHNFLRQHPKYLLSGFPFIKSENKFVYKGTEHRHFIKEPRRALPGVQLATYVVMITEIFRLAAGYHVVLKVVKGE